MMGDDKKDDVEPVTDADLGDVVGGRRSVPTTVTGKFSSNDTILGISSNDTLFSGSGDSKFNIGMPPGVKKR